MHQDYGARMDETEDHGGDLLYARPLPVRALIVPRDGGEAVRGGHVEDSCVVGPIGRAPQPDAGIRAQDTVQLT